jgi:uncharacterized protein (TIGR04255 family)
MTKRVIYKNPPLIESVFEIFFVPENWSPLVPLQFFEQIKADFPLIDQKQSGIGFDFNNAGINFGSNSTVYQFRNNTGNTIIQLNDKMLTVNKIPQYDGWENYSKVIQKAITILSDLLEIKNIQRVGLRTINKIDIKEHSYVDFRESFEIHPVIPSSVNSNFNSIQMTLETPNKSDLSVSFININTLNSEESYRAPVLFEVGKIKNTIELSDIKDWLEKAHDELTLTFNSCLTDTCKKRFNI